MSLREIEDGEDKREEREGAQGGKVRKISLVRKPSCSVAGASRCHWEKLKVDRIPSSSGGGKKGSGKP